MVERRRSPRPPLWLNITLLALAVATFAYARHHRNVVRAKSAILFRELNSTAELDRIRAELSQLALTRAELEKELDARLQYAKSLEGEEFYISIDTQRRKLQLRLGRDIVREAGVQVGEPRTIERGEKTWTFVPLKGGFNVVGKSQDLAWRAPEWLDPNRPTIPNGLGRYVIVLPNYYVIHSPPSPESPLKGPKPGSFMVPEADLASIWPRITNQTRVYIF